MTCLRSGDPARSLTDYYPSWLDNLADDVTIEGSAMDGVAHGPEAVRTILVAIRTLYKHQEFNFVGPVGDNGILEDYTAQVRGEPISWIRSPGVETEATVPGRSASTDEDQSRSSPRLSRRSATLVAAARM